MRTLVGDREILTERHLGTILSATVRGAVTPDDRTLAERTHLTIEAASLQEFVAALGLHALDEVARKTEVAS